MNTIKIKEALADLQQQRELFVNISILSRTIFGLKCGTYAVVPLIPPTILYRLICGSFGEFVRRVRNEYG